LIDSKADAAGAMMHVVTPELDRGPVVSYCLFSIKGKPFAKYWRKEDRNTLFRVIRQHELAREFPLITFTLQSLSRGELSIRERRVIDAQGRPISGYDLTQRVDEQVKKIPR
jgi:phosphoribosylglycinamide formyltransferase-1